MITLEEYKNFFKNLDSRNHGDENEAVAQGIEEFFGWVDHGPKDSEIGTVTRVKEFGGEGQGELMEKVVQVENGEVVQYFKTTGTWVSWDGAYWEDGETFEVVPKEVTVTNYVAVK